MRDASDPRYRLPMVTIANDQRQGAQVLPAGDYGLPVRDLLDVASLRGSSVLAGATGLDRVVRRLNVMEVPDILPWVKPHELLLTTGFPLRHAGAPADTTSQRGIAALVQLVCDLDARGLAAVGIKLGRYLEEIPRPVLATADSLGFPVLRLPEGVAFDEVISDVFTALLDRQSRPSGGRTRCIERSPRSCSRAETCRRSPTRWAGCSTLRCSFAPRTAACRLMAGWPRRSDGSRRCRCTTRPADSASSRSRPGLRRRRGRESW